MGKPSYARLPILRALKAIEHEILGMECPSSVLQAQSLGNTSSTILQLSLQYPFSLVIQNAFSLTGILHLIFPAVFMVLVSFGNNVHPPFEPTCPRILEPNLIPDFEGVVVL